MSESRRVGSRVVVAVAALALALGGCANEEESSPVAVSAPSRTPLSAESSPPDSEPPDEDLVQALGRLSDPDPEVRADAVTEIEAEGPGLSALLRALEDPDPRVRIAAIDQLEFTETPEVVSALSRVLHDPDPEVVLEAIDALQYIGHPAAIASLKPLLASPDIDIREAAESAIAFLE